MNINKKNSNKEINKKKLKKKRFDDLSNKLRSNLLKRKKNKLKN
ncbi:MAG: hypothetical protein CFH19_01228 [Alphaproteobacteria bacterium MarineAlpha5_Bin9]|nr:MAG: hypothetical protein CFH19_01228 [Alphaproteobacteria bacterium MarineAlpha5_Bin9]|tara:strand:+ start:256 stop:387 length:132 start_codon:yes stop_codon:yes gene_type:complete